MFARPSTTKTTQQNTLPPLRFHNTLSGTLETFTPISSGCVKMYNCGPTVYDRVHIGNLRAYVFANTLRRALDTWGYDVKQVINITDVGHLVSDADDGEDKMEKSAKKRGLSAQEIAQEITDLFFTDLDLLGIDRDTIQLPKATEFIAEQIALVQTLEEKGYAYIIADGVYFDTAKFASYGKLGNINVAEQKEGARVEENVEKKNPSDFALWKLSPNGEQRQQEWASPWGVGFPGWHIECTAMIFKLLGKQIDIHTGGIDHIPVHHNNEIAQAEAATGRQYVRYWMHGAFINIEGKRIAKSLGNTIYLQSIVDKGYSPRALRYWFLTGHYRSPMNFTWDALDGANTALKNLSRHMLDTTNSNTTTSDAQHSTQKAEPDAAFLADFYAAIADDLDTPKAIARVWELVKDASVSPEVKRASLLAADQVLGLGLADTQPVVKIEFMPIDTLPEEVRAIVAERQAARTDKNFARSDELRTQLASQGYEVTDSADGQHISKK